MNYKDEPITEPEKLLTKKDCWVDGDTKVISLAQYVIWKSQEVWRVIIGNREFEKMCREWNKC